jgi:hypothetical protein
MTDDQEKKPPRVEPFLGTDTLGRPLTNRERDALDAMLRAHDFVGASLVALRYAYTKTRSRQGAKDLLGRVHLRLVRQGWDPNAVTLVKCLCRFVWSEWTHSLEETATARRAEEVFLAEYEALEGPYAKSPEDHVLRLLAERVADARAAAELGELRAAFAEADDAVNLIWLELALRGFREPKDMAEESGRGVEEFYRAADRRKRTVQKLLAARGLKDEKEGES